MGLGGGRLTVNGMQAFHDCRQWVNYFLHTGHLHIEGLKMSKSLKNFITIDDALEKFTARQMRFAFLLQTWNARLDFKESVMQEVRSAESLLNVRLHYTTDNASPRIELMTCCASRTSSLSSRLATPRPKTWEATQMVDTTTRSPRRICLQGKSREKRGPTRLLKRGSIRLLISVSTDFKTRSTHSELRFAIPSTARLRSRSCSIRSLRPMRTFRVAARTSISGSSSPFPNGSRECCACSDSAKAQQPTLADRQSSDGVKPHKVPPTRLLTYVSSPLVYLMAAGTHVDAITLPAARNRTDAVPARPVRLPRSSSAARNERRGLVRIPRAVGPTSRR